MAKLKIVLFSLFFSVVSNSLLSYEITDLIKILIEKNETNSKFKYDNLIEDKNLQNADTYTYQKLITHLIFLIIIQVLQVHLIIIQILIL